jgi:hypothetical protein
MIIRSPVPVPHASRRNPTNWSTAASVISHPGALIGAGVRPVEHELRDAFWIRPGEEHRERTALGHAEERRGLHSGRVHHRADVVHALGEAPEADVPVRESRAAFVEVDEPREPGEFLIEAPEGRHLPDQLEVGDEAGDEDDVDRAVADDGVRDVDVARLRVPDLRLKHGAPPDGWPSREG